MQKYKIKRLGNKNLALRKNVYICRRKTNKDMMQLNTMNEAQMMILESFASATDEQEINDLMDVLRLFYARRLEQEMSRLWDNGTLNQEAICVSR